MNQASLKRNELQQSLARLHTELASAPQLNDASRQLLREVLADIERVLGASPGQGSPEVIETAPHRLQELAVDFEARHPALAASVRQFIDLLGSMGL